MQTIVAGLFLRCISGIFLIAFLSLYCQIPGLYGRNGILPVHGLLPLSEDPLIDFLKKGHTLLWFMPSIGLDPEHGMELLCLLGCALSGLMLLWERARSSVSFFVLWLMYLSVYQVGQTFLSFQWDILLLETGFLAIFVAPMFGGKPRNYNIGLWLVKWLLFRLMFASGVVKLTSRCPTWWGLTALDYHFESQCIPLPLAWFFHHSPEWFRRLSVVATYVIEIAAPFLFFLPVRGLRLLGFWLQIIFQISIILTGNYNFFNLLTCVLCLPLLDDKVFMSKSAAEKCTQQTWSVRALAFVVGLKASMFIHKAASRIVFFGVSAVVLYLTAVYFNVNFNSNGQFVETSVNFSEQEFFAALKYVMPLTIWMAVFSLAVKLAEGVLHCLEQRSVFSFLSSIVHIVLISSAAVFMFTISLVPHSVLDQGLQSRLWPVVHQWHHQTSSIHLTSPYGLFRHMTGVGGRPEVIVEGSNDLSSGWKEYDFLYKPGNVSGQPPIVTPHQPRLDWQMWFAALGRYQDNPWLISMVDRLLAGEKTVLDLIHRSPFQTPPKFIRGKLYHYHFTKLDDATSAWWRREEVGEYFPPLTSTEKSFRAFLDHHNLGDRNYPHQSNEGYVLDFLSLARQHCTGVSAPGLIGMLLFALLALHFTFRFFFPQ
eukprot:scpid49576/ scgid35198/ Lipase maturation factor 2